MSFSNHQPRPSSHFGQAANEVLRTGMPQYNPAPPYNPYPMPTNYGQPFYGGGGYPPGQGYPQYRAMPFHPMPMIPPMQIPQGNYNNNPNDDEDFEVMIKLIDKQRNILGGFAKALDKNKEDMLQDRTKQLKKNIKKMEKESVIRQLKLNNEQARLLKKLNAPYEFDPRQYDLSDVTDSDDEEDDDILLELLSNKIYFKKIKDLMAKKMKNKDQKNRLNGPLPDRTDQSGDVTPTDDTLGDSVVVSKKRKKKRRSKKSRTGDGEDDTSIME